MDQKPKVGIIRKLCGELNSHGVSYCHWKSNAMIDLSASGDNDLDLLVSRSDAQLFTKILYNLGFKQAQSRSYQQIPGILDFYGYDETADKIVHVHTHYHLILGHDATKNYHLPIEIPYLESAVQGDLFKIPSPEFEFVVFIIRMVLKHSTWDTVLGRQGKMSPAEHQEMVCLKSIVSNVKISHILKEHLPYLDAKLFNDCIQTLETDFKLWKRLRFGQKLQKALKEHARRPQVSDIWLKFWHRFARGLQHRVFGYIPKKRSDNGGLMVSIVGGDGAGKTTAVDELYAWLSKDFEAIKMHMGKPPWSLTTIAVRGILKIGRSLGCYPFMRAPIQYSLDSNSQIFPGYPWLLREICTARDRYLAYIKARRYASNGALAICDRFPLPQIKLMDGPQGERMTINCKTNLLIKLLIAFEKHYYKPIMLPELLIVLKADPNTAVRRKVDEDSASVRARSTEIWEMNWQQIPAYVIDANRSREEVLSELKALIWFKL